jgi:hypothetical protein
MDCALWVELIQSLWRVPIVDWLFPKYDMSLIMQIQQSPVQSGWVM